MFLPGEERRHELDSQSRTTATPQSTYQVSAYTMYISYIRIYSCATGEGALLMASVGSNANLAVVARRHDLVKHMRTMMTPAYSSLDTNQQYKGLGTMVEALLGAIYEDSGEDVEPVRRAIERLGIYPTELRRQYHDWTPQYCAVTVEVAHSNQVMPIVPHAIHPSRIGTNLDQVSPDRTAELTIRAAVAASPDDQDKHSRSLE